MGLAIKQKRKQVNLLNFIQQFPHETDCLEYYRNARERVGVVCSQCGGTEHSWLAGKSKFECTHCGRHTFINEGTIMEESELPIKYWFIAIHLLTSSQKYIGSAEIQKQLACSEAQAINLLSKLYELIEEGDLNDRFDDLLLACATSKKVCVYKQVETMVCRDK